MNERLRALQERRSVRNYRSQMPPQELIDEVMQAGLYAASGKGRQASIIVAITNADVRDRLSEINREIGGWQEGFDPFYGAPVVLAVLADRSHVTFVEDGSLVLGNLMQAAHDVGLDSCWIHRANETFEREEGRALLRSLDIPDSYRGIGFCILGYAAEEAKPAAPRKEGRLRYIR